MLIFQALSDASRDQLDVVPCAMEVSMAEVIAEGSLFRTIVDSLSDLVYVKDRQGRYVFSNAAHARFLGVDPSHVPGRSVFDFFPEELARKYRDDDARVMESGEDDLEALEATVDHDGRPRAVVRTKRALRTREGIIGLVGICRDVTERSRAQQSLQNLHETLEQQVAERTAAAEQRARELSFQKFALDQSAIVAATDATGRITYANDKFCQISGYSRKELIGHDHRMVNSGLHPKAFFKQMYATISRGTVWHGEIRNRAKDGSLYWVDTTIVPIIDDKDRAKINGYVAIRQDVTSHKEAEEALRQRTTELEAAVEAAERSNWEVGFQKFALDQHAIVAITDARGRITYVNDKFCEISRYSREELIGQDHRIVNSGLHPREFFKQMYATIAGGDVWHGEIRNRAKDGSLYWVDTTVVPTKDIDTGKIKGYVAIRADITALKHTQEHLQRAKEAAEGACQAKSEFLANMSHEIRTPMTAIIGYADLLSDSDRPVQERLQFVQTIRRNGEHLLKLINDLLDLTKVDAGKLKLEAIACDPAQLMDDVESCMRTRACAKGIKFNLDIDSCVPRYIFSDPTRLRQVLLNLVSNAIKFTERGGVQISLYLDSDSVLRFDVSDTGIGLTSEQQRAIFRPFAQADTSTTRRFGGTGLGLALSKRLVEMLGGRLTLVSEHGIGSTFSFTVVDHKDQASPVSKAALERCKSDESPVDETAFPVEQLNGRLLLVEDGGDNRQLVSIYLQDAGLTVESAEDGAEAVARVAEADRRGEPYDVILMDMQMPVMDGYQATAELRRRGFTTVPIIAFTAHALDGERDKCLAAGCDDYATKPVNPDALIRSIAKQLGRAGKAKCTDKPVVHSAPAADTSAASSRTAIAEATNASVPTQRLRSIFTDNAAVMRVLPSYVGRLSEHVEQMSTLLAEQRLDDLRRVVHQLKGSGGGYGFPDITQRAAEAEVIIDSNAAIEAIGDGIKKLCDLLRRVDGFASASESRRPVPEAPVA